MAKLTGKQQRFVDEYLIDLNATQAAARTGYSYKTARSQGNRLLTNVAIQQAIAEAKIERSKRISVDADYVLKRLVEIDEMDVIDIFNDSMTAIRPVAEWPEAWRKTLSGVELNELFEVSEGGKSLIGVVKKIKWPDKLKTLELLGKHVEVQAWKERVEVEKVDYEAILNERINRIEHQRGSQPF